MPHPEYDDVDRIGAAVRNRRQRLGLTQAEVAELAGTTQSRVSQVERGGAGHVVTVVSIASVLGLRLTLLDPTTGDEAPVGRAS